MKKKAIIGGLAAVILVIGVLIFNLEGAVENICRLHDADAIPYQAIDGLIDPWLGEKE